MSAVLKKIVSLLLMANIAGLWVADLHLVNEDLCQIHKNCCCPADRCTCRHEEAVSFDACAVSEWECASVPPTGLSFVFGFALLDARPADLWYSVKLLDWFHAGPPIDTLFPFDVFHPPKT